MAEHPKTDRKAPGTETPGKGERIAKRLARAGLCSRRDAERWIDAGRVSVDGKVLDSPALNVFPGQTILVDGNPLPDAEPPALWRYHKPSGLVTTNRDPQGRTTIFEKLPPDLPRVMTVGRLDLTTEGLLLLTNDGDLARYLELPSTGWTRRYRVRVNGRPDEAALARLATGVTIEGQRYDAIHAQLDRQQGANAWLTMSIREGKNREIRKVCDYLGLTVNRLIRVSYGPFQLGKLEKGAVERVPARIFREQLTKWPGLPAADKDVGDHGDPRSRERGPKRPAGGGAKAGSGGRPGKTGGKRPPRQDENRPTSRRPDDRATAKTSAASDTKAGPKKTHSGKRHGGKPGGQNGGHEGGKLRLKPGARERAGKNANRRRKP